MGLLGPSTTIWQRYTHAPKFSHGYARQATGCSPTAITLESGHYQFLVPPQGTKIPHRWLKETTLRPSHKLARAGRSCSKKSYYSIPSVHTVKEYGSQATPSVHVRPGIHKTSTPSGRRRTDPASPKASVPEPFLAFVPHPCPARAARKASLSQGPGAPFQELPASRLVVRKQSAVFQHQLAWQEGTLPAP